jgi:dTDP-4-dehydrorhamnose 3,5-epimerase
MPAARPAPGEPGYARRVRFTPTPLDGAWAIDLDLHEDERGAFARAFCEREFSDHGLPVRYPQCNLSINSRRGTLRGMHFNGEPYGEAKLVRCVRGALFDVIVDLRRDSLTRLDWFAIELTADNRRALFVPAGFAHGFITLADNTDAYYHMGDNFRPDASRGIRWDDPSLGIEWPMPPAVISPRDASYPDIEPANFDAATWDA